MDNINVPELVERLGSDQDAVRKMAAFKLQSNIGDPSFADIFIMEGGLSKLRILTLKATGNTLAYSLASFSRLLEVDKGWEYVNQDLVERVVELVVTHPLVNILRGAMSILVAVVSHPQQKMESGRSNQPGAFGFRALKPAIAVYPQFLEMLVSRLSSADHALCANALQLINSLMRDAVTNDADSEWPKFIKRLQDLGVIKAVYILMQSSALQDLAHPLLEFQSLTKVLLRKWREVKVDLAIPDHRRALKGLHLASGPERTQEQDKSDDTKGSRRHNPEKWRRLGFESEQPAWEFDEVGFLGMMDLSDFARKQEDNFRKLLLEQSTKSPLHRCPVARASLAVTSTLYDHFEVSKSDLEDAKTYLALDSRTNFDKLFRPLLLQWSRLHTAALQSFFRLWKATGAEVEEFDKVADLVRILVEQVVGSASRTRDIREVEVELKEFAYERLRELQMELLELTYEDAWGHHLRQVRDELHQEALQFVKEQRIRCLLQGSWFPNFPLNDPAQNELGNHKISFDTAGGAPATKPWRYVRLSHNRRYLHYADFADKGDFEPGLEELPAKIDLATVSSVESNISKDYPPSTSRPHTSASNHSDTSTLKNGDSSHLNGHQHNPSHAKSGSKSKPKIQPATTLTIHGHLPTSSITNPLSPTSPTTHIPPAQTNAAGSQAETPLLTLHPSTHSLTAEFLDGLLLLLNQSPLTSETAKLTKLIADYGLKIRLLNVRFDDAVFFGEEVPGLPGREGLGKELGEVKGSGGGMEGEGVGKGDGAEADEGFWYADFGG